MSKLLHCAQVEISMHSFNRSYKKHLIEQDFGRRHIEQDQQYSNKKLTKQRTSYGP